MEMKHEQHSNKKVHSKKMYKKLAFMTVLSCIAMYILMYSMVDKISNVVPNVNQFYMAGLMGMSMVLIELLVMGNMYINKKLNAIILTIGFVVMIGFYFSIRQQTAVGDKQFLKSMIPHHAAAILMVKKASLTDPEVKKLAENIITSQQAEIEQMKAKIKEMENAE